MGTYTVHTYCHVKPDQSNALNEYLYLNARISRSSSRLRWSPNRENRRLMSPDYERGCSTTNIRNLAAPPVSAQLPVPQPLAACKMLKVIKRTRLAKAQAERRKARKNAKNLRDRVAVTAQQNNFLWLEHHKAVKRAKDHHKEDWELGPLAPRRDVGDLKDKYGALSQHLLESPQLTSEERKKRIARFAGKGPRNFPYCNIRKGDRVVLLSGRDKGKIGKIRDVDLNKGEVKVEGLNKVCAVRSLYLDSHGDRSNLGRCGDS